MASAHPAGDPETSHQIIANRTWDGELRGAQNKQVSRKSRAKSLANRSNGEPGHGKFVSCGCSSCYGSESYDRTEQDDATDGLASFSFLAGRLQFTHANLSHYGPLGLVEGKSNEERRGPQIDTQLQRLS